MADLNHVVLIGRLTRDAELKYTAGGQAVCKFSIAVNRRKKNGDQWEDEANFFDIVLWGKQGESLQSYLVKGKMIGVDGELRQDRWQQEGQNRSKVEIIANYVQLLGGGGDRNDRQNFQNSLPNRNSQDNSSYNQSKDDGFADDIPF
ncbi:MAG: single-stranded DNA-binding protein [Treponema sp.]|nr:single-stranded DNA-binding protein [Treponema sp.]